MSTPCELDLARRRPSMSAQALGVSPEALAILLRGIAAREQVEGGIRDRGRSPVRRTRSGRARSATPVRARAVRQT
jgi:hypothetical protein